MGKKRIEDLIPADKLERILHIYFVLQYIETYPDIIGDKLALISKTLAELMDLKVLDDQFVVEWDLELRRQIKMPSEFLILKRAWSFIAKYNNNKKKGRKKNAKSIDVLLLMLMNALKGVRGRFPMLADFLIECKLMNCNYTQVNVQRRYERISVKERKAAVEIINLLSNIHGIVLPCLVQKSPRLLQALNCKTFEISQVTPTAHESIGEFSCSLNQNK